MAANKVFIVEDDAVIARAVAALGDNLAKVRLIPNDVSRSTVCRQF